MKIVNLQGIIFLFMMVALCSCGRDMITGDKGLLRPEIIKVTVSTDNIPPAVKEAKTEAPACDAPKLPRRSRPVDDKLLPPELRRNSSAVIATSPVKKDVEQVFPIPTTPGQVGSPDDLVHH